MNDQINTSLFYNENQLTFNEIKISNIIEKWQTPFYLYSESILKKSFLDFLNAAHKYNLDAMICFALKANPNKILLSILAQNGAGADIVSAGELLRALEAGIPSSKIVFSGVGKTSKEIELALDHDIYSFNVESIEELQLINEIAKHKSKTANIAFRLNPKVHAKTHKHISTGFKTHKFGIVESDILQAISDNSLWTNTKLIGISIHIGSQLTCLDATKEAIIKMCQCANSLNIDLKFLDVGGGLGIDYDSKNPSAPNVNQYMELVSNTIQSHYKKPIKIIFEPGRVICAKAAIFVTSVIRTKESEGNHFTIVDGGMNDFVRPSLYDAFHEIYPCLNTKELVVTDIVGPICETTDCFGRRELSKLKSGDFIAIADAGAYGHSMSSHYNLRPRPIELLITNENKVECINKCETYKDLI